MRVSRGFWIKVNPATQPPTTQHLTTTERTMTFRVSTFIDPNADYDHLRQVEFIDALMGRGKTTEAIRHAEEDVRTNPQACWMVCCGPLSEVETRPLENECMKEFWHRPEDSKSTKEESLLTLLQDPTVRLIALTHALWKQATTNPYLLHLVSQRRFSIVFDEVPDDWVDIYKRISPGDFQRAHIKTELAVYPDEFGRVEWLDDAISLIEGPTHVDSLIREQKRVRAYVNGKQYSVLDMPFDGALRAFRRVLVTTYLAPRSVFTAYLEMHGIPWTYCNDIVPQRRMTKADIRKLITFETGYDRQFSKWKLDSSWYKKAEREQLNEIGKAIRNIGIAHCDGDPTRLAFTAMKGRVAKTQTAPGMKAKGYTSFIHLKGKPRNDDHIDKYASCFIRCNAKASNEYRHKDVLVHAYNRYPLEPVRRFFHGYGLDFDPDHYALTEMLQWVWRSAIRDGKPIRLAILSARMRELFQTWLAENERNVVRLPTRSQPPPCVTTSHEQTLDEWLALYG
jgi:hypothetical protein